MSQFVMFACPGEPLDPAPLPSTVEVLDQGAAPSVATSATQTSALPRTGTNTRGLALVGLGLVLLGVGAVLIRRSDALI
ncbi:MAG: LPXTG cell wall anchor domain-containing protein [Acidimicrobiales bacterium]